MSNLKKKSIFLLQFCVMDLFFCKCAQNNSTKRSYESYQSIPLIFTPFPYTILIKICILICCFFSVISNFREKANRCDVTGVGTLWHRNSCVILLTKCLQCVIFDGRAVQLSPDGPESIAKHSFFPYYSFNSLRILIDLHNIFLVIENNRKYFENCK